MKKLIPCLALVAALCLLPAVAEESGDESAAQANAELMAVMMEKAKQVTAPGIHHETLKRFIGTWDIESRFIMGGKKTPPEKGTMTTSWLIEGRWLKWESKGTMMGMPIEGFVIMGYDNFKQSYVVTMVSSMDTAMLRAEGDMDPGGKALLAYGTLDEYLTGEHDKMVKYVWRFESDDRIVMELHDLPIGEKNTQVMEQTYTRRKP